jgi:hypothetical protein
MLVAFASFATATFFVAFGWIHEAVDFAWRKSKVGLPQQCEPELFFVNPR